MSRWIQSSLIAAAVTLSLPAAAQFQKPEDAVKYRQSAMTLMGNHMGRLGAMAQGRVPFDAAQAQANADVIATVSKLPFVAYVEGTPGANKGGASPKIWSDRAKFDEAARKMQDEVAKLVAATRGGNAEQLRAAFGPVGGSCKGCHDDFRNP